MKINGQYPQSHQVYSFTLNRTSGHPLTFRLRPLPLGFQNQLRQRGLFPPTPPVTVTRDSTGKPIRDQQGMALTQFDSNDQNYQADLELYHQRVAVVAIIESLRDDDEIVFESTLTGDHPSSWREYADAVFAELEEAGFTAGDLISLCHEVCKLSNLTDQHLSAAQANFCSPTLTDST